MSITTNDKISINIRNNMNLDTVFDIVVEDTSHLFVDDAVPTVVNNARTFALSAKKAGNSRVQIIGR